MGGWPMELTAPEIRVLLWHVRVVDHAYGNEAPCQSTIDNVKHKLLAELGADGGHDPQPAGVAPQSARLP